VEQVAKVLKIFTETIANIQRFSTALIREDHQPRIEGDLEWAEEVSYPKTEAVMA
jgi:hypothetical protein